MIVTGDSNYINQIFLPKIQGKFDTIVIKSERVGGEFNFLRGKYELEVDGFLIQSGKLSPAKPATIRQLNPDGGQVRCLT